MFKGLYVLLSSSISAIASAVYEATWFIIMMVVLALLLLILIIVCLVKRNRGDKYHGKLV